MEQKRSVAKIALIVAGILLAAILIGAGSFFGGYFYKSNLQQKEEQDAKKEKGRVELSSEPENLTVFVNGKEQTKGTPLALNNLDPGKLELLLKSDKTLDWTAVVKVKAGETLVVKAIPLEKPTKKKATQAEEEEETKTPDLVQATVMINKFMALRMKRDATGALNYCTDHAKELYAPDKSVVLAGISNPHYAKYEILSKKKLASTKYQFGVRIYQELSGEGESGSFDETITIVKSGGKYLVDLIEQKQ